ncbi:MAG: hypothetical protein L0K75_09490 [Enterococcaceae bacterium]|nr:hypothetical protein [Enterococcaceae bacterium]
MIGILPRGLSATNDTLILVVSHSTNCLTRNTKTDRSLITTDLVRLTIVSTATNLNSLV